LAAGGGNGTVILRDITELNLDNLLLQGCSFMHDYLQYNQKVRESDRA
jgi:hypothetical protein